jgi:hypothetical protein
LLHFFISASLHRFMASFLHFFISSSLFISHDTK